MTHTTYGHVLARNIRAARGRNGISQQVLAARMRAFGYDAWLHQTVGNVEKGRRRVMAEEIWGLSEALQTSIGKLMTPDDDDEIVAFPSGATVTVEHLRRSVLGRNDGEVKWSGDDPVFPGPPLTRNTARAAYEALDPESRAALDRVRSLLPQEEPDR
jgi:transcriptional regulator with XRE-family HTH domain